MTASDAGAPGGGALTLADLRPGDRATVTRLAGPALAMGRLAEMGVTAGAAVQVVRFAPLGDPVEIRVRGYMLTVRKADARGVEVARAAAS